MNRLCMCYILYKGGVLWLWIAARVLETTPRNNDWLYSRWVTQMEAGSLSQRALSSHAEESVTHTAFQVMSTAIRLDEA